MKLTNFSARSLIASLSLGIGLAVLLFSNYSPLSPQWLQPLDATCVQRIFSSASSVTSYDAVTKTISVQTLAADPKNCRELQDITITDDPSRIFETSPPSPLDYAIILQKLYEQGYRSVILTTRMTWDQDPVSTDATPTGTDNIQLSTQALSYKLAQFDRAVIALPITRGATPQDLPAALQRALIPFDQVHGNSQLIPTVNQVSLPTTMDGGINTLAGFSRIESTPESDTHIPLLAHWENQGLIPSLELLTIMSAHGISPSDVSVQCGKFIRLGTTGPVIPIDEYGQTPPPSDNANHPSRTPPTAQKAEDILTKKTPSSTAAIAPPTNTLCIIHADGEKTNPTNLLTAQRLTQLKTLCETLPTPGEPTIYHKLPLIYELLILLALALITGRLATLTPYNRHLAFALTLPLIIITLLVLMDSTHQWFGLTAPIIAILTAWLTASCLNPKS